MLNLAFFCNKASFYTSSSETLIKHYYCLVFVVPVGFGLRHLIPARHWLFIIKVYFCASYHFAKNTVDNLMN